MKFQTVLFRLFSAIVWKLLIDSSSSMQWLKCQVWKKLLQQPSNFFWKFIINWANCISNVEVKSLRIGKKAKKQVNEEISSANLSELFFLSKVNELWLWNSLNKIIVLIQKCLVDKRFSHLWKNVKREKFPPPNDESWLELL